MFRPATDAEKRRFDEACAQVMFEGVSADGGVGTLSEKTLHAVLKRFYEPDASCREIPVGRFVADICRDKRIVEVQTRSFYVLRDKLAFFLSEGYDVTVVHPVPAVRTVSYVEPDGTVGMKRVVTRKGDAGAAFAELYRIKSLLPDPHLHVRLAMLDVSDYRLRGGKSRRGSDKLDRVPNALVGQVFLQDAADYASLLDAAELPAEPFTAAALAAALHVPKKHASTAAPVFCAVGVLEKVGKTGRAFLYARTKSEEIVENS